MLRKGRWKKEVRESSVRIYMVEKKKKKRERGDGGKQGREQKVLYQSVLNAGKEKGNQEGRKKIEGIFR